MPCKWNGAALLLAFLPADWYWQDYWGALLAFNGVGRVGFLSSNSASFPLSWLWAVFCDCLCSWLLQKLVFTFLQYCVVLVWLVLCFSLHRESWFCGFAMSGCCVWMNFSPEYFSLCLLAQFLFFIPSDTLCFSSWSYVSMDIQVLILCKSIPEAWKVV